MSDTSKTGYEETIGDRATISESSIFLRLVNRYISVWVWSILFGLATSLSFAISNVRNAGRFGDLSLVVTSLYLVSGLFVLSAWFTLLRYLRTFLIPMIFSGSEGPFSHGPIVFRNLYYALLSLIMAIIGLMSASVLSAVLEYSVAPR